LIEDRAAAVLIIDLSNGLWYFAVSQSLHLPLRYDLKSSLTSAEGVAMKYRFRVAFALAALLFVSLSQSTTARQQSGAERSEPVARGTDVFCTGFIADMPPRTDLQIVGAEKENMKVTYAQGDVVFLNKGRGSGIQSGAVYYIIRPLGEVKHPFTKKKMGHYVRELGSLRVIEVQDQTSAAEITLSCDTIEFGDLLLPYERYDSPDPRDARPLPRYGEGSGGINGQIVMAPGFHENLSANRVVFIDIGDLQNVRSGDYFTIYRETGRREGITNVPQDKVVENKSGGFGSDRFRGGDFSVQGTHQSRDQVQKTRPEVPRKVLGELIVLKVEKNTSVALITRTTAEVNIGDHVERSN
jgi:hypothetical protein